MKASFTINTIIIYFILLAISCLFAAAEEGDDNDVLSSLINLPDEELTDELNRRWFGAPLIKSDAIRLLNEAIDNLHPTSCSQRLKKYPDESRLLLSILTNEEQILEDAENCDNSNDGEYEEPLRTNVGRTISLNTMQIIINMYEGINGQRKRTEQGIQSVYDWFDRHYIPKFKEKLAASSQTTRSKYGIIDRHVYNVFCEARENLRPVHGRMIKRWARQKADELGLADFKASENWLSRFKKRNNLVSRKVTDYASRSYLDNLGKIEESIKNFTANYTRESAKFSPATILNFDQTGFNYESTNLRTISHKGERDTVLRVNDANKPKNSLSANPMISRNGRIFPTLAIVMKEPSGNFGPRVMANVKQLEEKYGNLVIYASKSGKFTSELMEKWFEGSFRDAIRAVRGARNQSSRRNQNDILVLADSWGGHSAPRQKEMLENMGVAFLQIPKLTTDKLQPLDVNFNRQYKIFINRITEESYYENLITNVTSREGILNVHSLVHNQFQSAAYRDMIRYAWHNTDPSFNISELTNYPPKMVRSIQFDFNEQEKCSVAGCNHSSFVRCSHCGKILCLHHFLARKCYHDHTTMRRDKRSILSVQREIDALQDRVDERSLEVIAKPYINILNKFSIFFENSKIGLASRAFRTLLRIDDGLPINMKLAMVLYNQFKNTMDERTNGTQGTAESEQEVDEVEEELNTNSSSIVNIGQTNSARPRANISLTLATENPANPIMIQTDSGSANADKDEATTQPATEYTIETVETTKSQRRSDIIIDSGVRSRLDFETITANASTLLKPQMKMKDTSSNRIVTSVPATTGPSIAVVTTSLHLADASITTTTSEPTSAVFNPERQIDIASANNSTLGILLSKNSSQIGSSVSGSSDAITLQVVGLAIPAVAATAIAPTSGLAVAATAIAPTSGLVVAGLAPIAASLPENLLPTNNANGLRVEGAKTASRDGLIKLKQTTTPIPFTTTNIDGTISVTEAQPAREPVTELPNTPAKSIRTRLSDLIKSVTRIQAEKNSGIHSTGQSNEMIGKGGDCKHASLEKAEELLDDLFELSRELADHLNDSVDSTNSTVTNRIRRYVNEEASRDSNTSSASRDATNLDEGSMDIDAKIDPPTKNGSISLSASDIPKMIDATVNVAERLVDLYSQFKQTPTREPAHDHNMPANSFDRPEISSADQRSVTTSTTNDPKPKLSRSRQTSSSESIIRPPKISSRRRKPGRSHVEI